MPGKLRENKTSTQQIKILFVHAGDFKSFESFKFQTFTQLNTLVLCN